MISILFVGLGGFLGAISRHLIFEYLTYQSLFKITLINTLGCLAFGFLYVSLKDSWQLFILTGFLGSFTTFSTFIFIIQEHFQKLGFVSSFYVLQLQIILGIIAMALGLWVSSFLLK